jgi:c-di-GMP-binding flagellar brake protein YcgR
MAASCTMIERRRASRVRIGLPLTIVREDEQPEAEPARAYTLEVSRCGARLKAPFAAPIGTRILVRNERSQESREFRIIRVSERKSDGMVELGVEILYPARNFWDVRFPDESSDYAEAVVESEFPRA